jgi:AraC-like DNA-binding protein
MLDTQAEKASVRANSTDAPQRLAVLVGLPGMLAEYGIPLEQALEGLPIRPEQFGDPEARVPFWAAGTLLERCAVLTNCPHFGLSLGSRHDHRILGVAGEWLRRAPDLATALSGWVTLQPAASRGAVVYLHRMDDSVLLGYGIYDRDAVAHEQIYAFSVAVGFNLVRSLTNGAVRPMEVLISIRPPLDPTPFTTVFTAPVRFDQPQTAILLSPAALATPVAKASAPDLGQAQQLAFATMPPPDRIWSDRVSRALRILLLTGEPTASVVAAKLGVHVRTLSRHLQAEGTSFQALLDDIRFSVARELLSVTDLTVGDVAFALAYATHGAFADAFRRWSGMSASAWRAAARAG